jgi:hypothetical protein
VRKQHDGNGYVVAKSLVRILDRTGSEEVVSMLDPDVNHLGCIWSIVDEDSCELLDMTLGVGPLRLLEDGLSQGTLVCSISGVVQVASGG